MPRVAAHLDLLSGLAVNALGPRASHRAVGRHRPDRHPRHVSNFFATPAQVALAQRLTAMTGTDDARVFFTNSGTEANEAAFKITRMTGRTKIISTEGAFHGRSLGALAITHNPKYRAPVRAVARRRDLRPVRGCERTGGGRRRHGRRGGARADPGGERRRGAAGRLPGRRPGRSATGTAPCCGSTRCRPGWAGPAPGWPTCDEGVTRRRRHRRQGARQRLPDRGLPGHRSSRAACSAPAATAAPSAATRWQRSPGWPSSR